VRASSGLPRGQRFPTLSFGYDIHVTARDRTRLVKEMAAQAGFDRVGIAAAAPPPHADFLREWLDRGYAGSMDYLHRHLDIRLDPRRLMPNARSIICVAMNYYQTDKGRFCFSGEAPPDAVRAARGEKSRMSPFPGARIARYAWGQDYHTFIRKRLSLMIRHIRHAIGAEFGSRVFVDTAPVLERPLASAAGLGWIGKNSLLIVPRLGSFVLLGGAMTSLDLEPDDPAADRCGRCTRCIEACPSRAIVRPRVVDARRCISFLTIENRDAIPPEHRPCIGQWLFGCDICQEVCPHNRRATAANEPAFRVRAPAPAADPRELLRWSGEQYDLASRGRAIRRATLNMLRRNAAVVLGNLGRQEDIGMLESLAEGDQPLVAEHARWARERIRSS
jgi:epoxyqueuosine reductase